MESPPIVGGFDFSDGDRERGCVVNRWRYLWRWLNLPDVTTISEDFPDYTWIEFRAEMSKSIMNHCASPFGFRYFWGEEISGGSSQQQLRERRLVFGRRRCKLRSVPSGVHKLWTFHFFSPTLAAISRALYIHTHSLLLVLYLHVWVMFIWLGRTERGGGRLFRHLQKNLPLWPFPVSRTYRTSDRISDRVSYLLFRGRDIFATATSHSTIRNPLGRSRKGICKRWQPSNKRVPQFQALRQIVTQDEISMIEALFSDVETTVSGSLARDTDFCRVDDVLRFRFSKKKLSPKRGKKEPGQ